MMRLTGTFFTSFLLIYCSRVLGFQNQAFIGSKRSQASLELAASPSKEDNELSMLERQVKGSVQAQMDLKRVSEALDLTPSNIESSDSTANIAPRWQIALASAIFCSVSTEILLQSTIFSIAIFVATFFLAIRDPMEEEGAAGAGARLVGRFAINSVEVSKPKIKAVARAAMTNEEDIARLQQQISELKEENTQLRIWKERRMVIDERISDYTLDELKEIARKNRLPVGGTKAILMMRLAEAEAIDL